MSGIYGSLPVYFGYGNRSKNTKSTLERTVVTQAEDSHADESSTEPLKINGRVAPIPFSEIPAGIEILRIQKLGLLGFQREGIETEHTLRNSRVKGRSSEQR